MAITEIEQFIASIENLVPEYMAIPEDLAISKGGASLCIIGEDGTVYGKIFGTDKLRGREPLKLHGPKPARFGLPVTRPTITNGWYLPTKLITTPSESVCQTWWALKADSPSPYMTGQDWPLDSAVSGAAAIWRLF